jgi:hypothetical protein
VPLERCPTDGADTGNTYYWVPATSWYECLPDTPAPPYPNAEGYWRRHELGGWGADCQPWRIQAPLIPETGTAPAVEQPTWLMMEEQREQRRLARTRATDRATTILRELLTPQQRADFERDRAFQVVGSAGGLYRIRYGTAGNVEWWEPGSPSEVAGVLCAHPDMWDGVGWLPTPDVMLAQMLALTTDEPGFVRTANVHRGRRPAHIPA